MPFRVRIHTITLFVHLNYPFRLQALTGKRIQSNPRTMPRRAAARPGRGIRGTRIPRGKARIVRGFCEFAGRIIIVRNSAPFRAILGADLRVRARI